MPVEKKNIILNDITERMAYKSSAHPITKKYPTRQDYVAHAGYVKRQYSAVMKQSLDQRQVAAIKMKGTYAEFSGVEGLELATKSLENRQAGIRLLNVQTINGVMKATVYIPEGKEEFFIKRMDAYASETTKKGNPKHQDLIGSIENIKLAMVDSFWTDELDALPTDTAINCEVWLRYEIKKTDSEPWNSVEEEFHNICDELTITVDKGKRILFPERIVKLITANRDKLKSLITSCEYISEIRRAEEPASFFTNLSHSYQRMWSEDLLSRCDFTHTGTSICLLDAGLNDQHPLLAPAILENGLHSVEDSWGTRDSQLWGGHGTEMAGLAVYGDLQEALETQEPIEVNHKLESVKILPDVGRNKRDLYGAITQQAVAIAEIDNPNVNRVLCMAVTSNEHPDKDGRPSSWSATLDKITSAVNEEDSEHRLFIVSGGNIHPTAFENGRFPDINALENVQNPAQSWNAVTVGGYAGKVEISEEGYQGYQALAPKDGLSPFSTTSLSWSRIWPIKPEVLFNAGNVATNGQDYATCDDLSLLTTGHRLSANLYSTINATSAATAQAANFSAKLMAEYPGLWPETIRALLIHSATWTDEMHNQFCEKGYGTTKMKRGILLRNCGYGIPDLNRAIQCANNSVNMIVQGEIQPFRKDGSTVKMNEMHIHSFPWPNEVLRGLGETDVKLRITLSYYIEPSPGEVGWKDRYRYPSCGLRFEINKVNQSLDEFKKQVSKMAAEEDKAEETTSSTANDWYLGPKNRNVGSIHSDFIICNAVDLCERNYVAVYPIGGWWKERPYLKKTDKKVKYALVVSLETPSVEVDLYTPIINEISTVVPVTVPIYSEEV